MRRRRIAPVPSTFLLAAVLIAAALLMAATPACGTGSSTSEGTGSADTGLRKPAGSPPNIVFILLDDLGYEELSSYGNVEVETPNIDRLAAEGTRYTSFYVNSPVCSPARAGIMTGNYPQRYNITEVIGPRSLRGIPGNVPTIAEILKQRGYETAHIGKWHLGETLPEFAPASHGFDEVALITYDSRNSYFDPILHVTGGSKVNEKGHETEILTRRAEEFIRKSRTRPFFLNLWYSAPHEPYEPPAEWASKFPDDLRGRYLALLADADEKIGRLMALLRSMNIDGETLVVFASDNGGQRKALAKERELRGSKSDLFEAGIRVPLIVRFPGKVPAGRVDGSTILGFDLFPTFAEISGADPSALHLDGRSFATSLMGGAQPGAREAVFWSKRQRAETPTELYAVREGDWKLLFENGTHRLFDFSLAGEKLPSEEDESDLAASHPDIAAKLEQEYFAWRVSSSAVPYRVGGTGGAARVAKDGLYEFPPPGGVVRIEPERLLDFHDGDFTFTTLVRLDAAAGVPGSGGTGSVIASKRGSWTVAILPGPRLEASIALDSKSHSTLTVSSGDLDWKPGAWHRVALTVYGQTPRSREAVFQLWSDAAEVGRATANWPVAPSESGVSLGADEDGGRAFVGSLKDVGFHVAPLIPQEMQLLPSD